MNEWKKKWRLTLAFILITAGAYGNSRAAFGDTTPTVLIAVGVGMLFTDLLRRVIHRDEEIAVDEMTKRISGASSDVAFFVTIAAIGALSLAVRYYPAILDANKI